MKTATEKQLRDKAKITSKWTVLEASALIVGETYSKDENPSEQINKLSNEIIGNFEKDPEKVVNRIVRFGRFSKKINAEKILAIPNASQLPISYYYSLVKEGKLPSLRGKELPQIFVFYEKNMLDLAENVYFLEKIKFPILKIIELAREVRKHFWQPILKEESHEVQAPSNEDIMAWLKEKNSNSKRKLIVRQLQCIMESIRPKKYRKNGK